MPIVGRDLDVSERKEVLFWSSQGSGQSLPPTGQVIATGTTMTVAMIGFPCTLQSGLVFSSGLSASPQIALSIQRFAAGSTVIAVGISNMVLTTFGTSGAQGLSGLPPVGSTLLNFQAGDLVLVTTQASNTAIGTLAIQLVLKKTQDIVAYQGVSS